MLDCLGAATDKVKDLSQARDTAAALHLPAASFGLVYFSESLRGCLRTADPPAVCWPTQLARDVCVVHSPDPPPK